MHGDTFDRRGFRQEWLPGDEPWSDPLYALEDPSGLGAILNRQYHAVVGNPPYITVKDATLNARYRNRWATCHRQYSLGVPFTERFFDLAVAGDNGRPAGFVGMITANSFMKREFGKKLIEAFFPAVDLTHRDGGGSGDVWEASVEHGRGWGGGAERTDRAQFSIAAKRARRASDRAGGPDRGRRTVHVRPAEEMQEPVPGPRIPGCSAWRLAQGLVGTHRHLGLVPVRRRSRYVGHAPPNVALADVARQPRYVPGHHG
jgi:hypothetical protein